MRKTVSSVDVVLPSSDKAATRTTIDAWVSRTGHVYFDERAARWDGATHDTCAGCTIAIPKGGWALCEDCRENKAWERWNAAPKVEWDKSTPLFSDATGDYFFDVESLHDFCADRETNAENLRLYLCQPLYGREIDADHFADELPEDGELPDAIVDAMKSFNQIVRDCGPLSWEPSATAVLLGQEEQS